MFPLAALATARLSHRIGSNVQSDAISGASEADNADADDEESDSDDHIPARAPSAPTLPTLADSTAPAAEAFWRSIDDHIAAELSARGISKETAYHKYACPPAAPGVSPASVGRSKKKTVGTKALQRLQRKARRVRFLKGHPDELDQLVLALQGSKESAEGSRAGTAQGGDSDLVDGSASCDDGGGIGLANDDIDWGSDEGEVGLGAPDADVSDRELVADFDGDVGESVANEGAGDASDDPESEGVMQNTELRGGDDCASGDDEEKPTTEPVVRTANSDKLLFDSPMLYRGMRVSFGCIDPGKRWNLPTIKRVEAVYSGILEDVIPTEGRPKLTVVWDSVMFVDCRCESPARHPVLGGPYSLSPATPSGGLGATCARTAGCTD